MRTFSRDFVYKILGFHLLLLAGVLALVWLSSAEIYTSARDEELLQARKRQQLLSDQICRGIETYYDSIIKDLGWIQRRSDLDATRPALGAAGSEASLRLVGSQSLDGPPGAIGPNIANENAARLMQTGARSLAGRVLSEELGDRVSSLFYYNKRNGVVIPILPEHAPAGGNFLPKDIQAWLRQVDETKVSRFMKLQGVGVSLVATPFGPRDPRLLVAVVPGDRIEAKFLPLLTDQNSASATLVDGQVNVITSSTKTMLGLNLVDDIEPGDMRELVLNYRSNPRSITRQVAQTATIHSVDFDPRLVTISPITISGDQWGLFLAFPLADIDSSVNGMFKRAAVWAAFVAVSVTGILVSTAIQMIRYRTGLERIRHEMLTRELSQARQIQLSWLPDKSHAGPSIDVAAINHPASHISGDFYNWFELADGRQVITIGDVTGHGMAAAFLMATTQLLVRNTMMRLEDPGASLEEVNRQLSTQMFHGQFVTMLIMVLDFEHGHIDVASAGHPSPLISEGGEYREVPVEAQLVLGVEKTIRYPTQRFELPRKANFVLYTDGVVDVLAASGERYSIAKLQASLNGVCGNAQQMLDAVLAALDKFRAGREIDDDLTMVAIQVQGMGEGERLTAANVERRATLSLSANS